MSTTSSAPAPHQPTSFDQLLADLLQVVSEILLLRRPRIQTASVMPEPPPDLLADVSPDVCPYCPTEGASMKKQSRLVR